MHGSYAINCTFCLKVFFFSHGKSFPATLRLIFGMHVFHPRRQTPSLGNWFAVRLGWEGISYCELRSQKKKPIFTVRTHNLKFGGDLVYQFL